LTWRSGFSRWFGCIDTRSSCPVWMGWNSVFVPCLLWTETQHSQFVFSKTKQNIHSWWAKGSCSLLKEKINKLKECAPYILVNAMIPLLILPWLHGPLFLLPSTISGYPAFQEIYLLTYRIFSLQWNIWVVNKSSVQTKKRMVEEETVP
jgi:hypothetical protein